MTLDSSGSFFLARRTISSLVFLKRSSERKTVARIGGGSAVFVNEHAEVADIEVGGSVFR